MGEKEVTQPCWDVETGSKVRAMHRGCCSGSLFQLHSASSQHPRRPHCYQQARAVLHRGPAWELVCCCNRVQPISMTLRVEIKKVLWLMMMFILWGWAVLLAAGRWVCCGAYWAQAVGMNWWQSSVTFICQKGQERKGWLWGHVRRRHKQSWSEVQFECMATPVWFV